MGSLQNQVFGEELSRDYVRLRLKIDKLGPR